MQIHIHRVKTVQLMKEVNKFKYLGSILDKDGIMGEATRESSAGKESDTIIRAQRGKTVSMEVKLALRDSIIMLTLM